MMLLGTESQNLWLFLKIKICLSKGILPTIISLSEECLEEKFIDGIEVDYIFKNRINVSKL